MTNNEESNNGWHEWGKFVLKELERLNKVISDLMNAYNQELKGIRADISKMEVNNSKDITALKVKSGVWGLIGGLIPVLITVALFWMNFTAAEHKHEETMKLVMDKLSSAIQTEDVISYKPSTGTVTADIYRGKENGRTTSKTN